jgi:hypothetical protein
LLSAEGGCQPGVWDYNGHSLSGDGVTDTPAHYAATENYYGANSCWTDYVLDTCQDVPGIDPGVDPIDNYMNYLTADCWKKRGRFTLGQVERMLASFEQFRDPSSTYLGTTLTYTLPYSAAGTTSNSVTNNVGSAPAIAGSNWNKMTGLTLVIPNP